MSVNMFDDIPPVSQMNSMPGQMPGFPGQRPMGPQFGMPPGKPVRFFLSIDINRPRGHINLAFPGSL